MYLVSAWTVVVMPMFLANVIAFSHQINGLLSALEPERARDKR